MKNKAKKVRGKEKTKVIGTKFRYASEKRVEKETYFKNFLANKI
jgi:hypothetical protein